MRDSYGYLPQRISGGSFASEGFEVILRERAAILPWENIRMVFLGIVKEPLLEAPVTTYTRMKEVIGRLFRSGGRGKREKTPLVREKVYVEIFVGEEERPYRLESSSFNYRGLLPEVDYISESNLKKFLELFSRKLPNCKFDKSFWAYLANQKASAGQYGNIYEFQRYCFDAWENERKGKTA